MATLELIPIETNLAAKLSSDPEALARLCANASEVAEIVGAVVPATLEFQHRIGAKVPWIGYLALDLDSKLLVGTCSFKGMPQNGSVEIAYFTFPPYEGAGYAGAMASHLIEIALSSPEVVEIAAQTLPEVNASTRILERRGFVRSGIAQDDEAGEVWCWRLPR